jgi:NAD+ synthase
MPEVESSADSSVLAHALAVKLAIQTSEEDITPTLEALGCYQRRDEAIRQVVPEFGEGYRSKVVLPDLFGNSTYRLYSIVVESPEGEQKRVRLSHDAYLEILAANSFKQRVRKMIEYYYADKLHYAVAGTPNRLEFDQGFFVKNGDGSADLKPIAHLYKSQVYQLAEYLGLPEEICGRLPTTDTFSLPQSQEEFYFSLPYREMDLCLYGKNHGVPAEEVASVVGLTAEQVERVYRDIDAKRRATAYLHARPVLMEEIGEVSLWPGA